MSVTIIEISLVAGSIKVEPYAPVLDKSKKDKVKWKAKPSTLDFVVCFGNKTPFRHKHFFSKFRSESGPIKITPCGAEEYFKYSVEIGDKVLDPGIIITR